MASLKSALRRSSRDARLRSRPSSNFFAIMESADRGEFPVTGTIVRCPDNNLLQKCPSFARDFIFNYTSGDTTAKVFSTL